MGFWKNWQTEQWERQEAMDGEVTDDTRLLYPCVLSDEGGDVNDLLDRAKRLAMSRDGLMDYRIPDFGDLWQPDLTYLPNGWAVAVAHVGPKLAAAMLTHNADNQRKIVRSSVNRFAADMASGNWRLTHQGIAFNRRGYLHDGQHRLTAVVESGATVPMVVFFGAGDQHEMTVIDTNKARNAVDAARILNIDVNSHITATLTQAYRFARPPRSPAVAVTHSLTLALVGRYREVVHEIISWFAGNPTPIVARAPIRAAIFAAHVSDYSVPVLRRFTHVLCDKEPATEPGDAAPKLLRQQIGNFAHNSGRSAMMATDIYLRTCQAIIYAAENRPVKVLRPAAETPFILPEHR